MTDVLARRPLRPRSDQETSPAEALELPLAGKPKTGLKPAAKAVRVCKYGARLLGGEPARQRVQAILLAQNRLWNKFVEIERAARSEYRQALVSADAELDELTAKAEILKASLQELVEARNRERAAQRRKKTDDAASFAEQIKARRSGLKALFQQMAALKQRAKAAATPLVQRVEQERRTRISAALKDAGLWWCHSETVLARYETARSRAMKAGTELQFRRFEGEGSFGVRFTKGMCLSSILDGRTSLLELRRPTSQELGRAVEVKNDGGRRVVFKVRAGDKGRETGEIPFLEFLVTMHAGIEFPQDLAPKTLSVLCDAQPGRLEFHVAFMFSGASAPGPLTELPTMCVGVDFGWRQVQHHGETGLRVATLSRGPGSVEHIVLDAAWLKRMERADTLRSQLDSGAEAIWKHVRDPLMAQLPALAPDSLPAVLAAKALRAKRAYPSLLMALCSANSAAGDPLGVEVTQLLRSWQPVARRLAIDAFHTRRKAREHRTHLYRNIAAKLARDVGMIALKDITFAKLSRREDAAGNDNPLPETARRNRMLAAPSELRSAIVAAASRERRELLDVPPAGTSRQCSSCGHLHGPLGADSVFVCDGCSTVWDQDVNSAHNCRNLGMSDCGSPRIGDAC